MLFDLPCLTRGAERVGGSTVIDVRASEKAVSRIATESTRRMDVTNTGNGDRGPGTGDRGTSEQRNLGIWELVYSGNPLENSKWLTKQK